MKRDKPLIGITTDVKDGHSSIEAEYARAVARAGGIPVLIPSAAGDGDLLEETALLIDGLLLPGSRDMDPKFYNEEPHEKLRPMSLERTETELGLLREAVDKGIPVLGICGGMQLINVFMGGSLYQDIRSFLPGALNHEKGSVHDVTAGEGTLLGNITGSGAFPVKSYHHQAVKKLGGGLRASASAPDGIVEGIESGEHPFLLGIQWHPEREDGEISRLIIGRFVNECVRRSRSR